jgi:SAP domain-containing ribonucleoprotein
LAATEIDDIADDPLEPVKNDTPETEKKEETEKKAEAEPAAPVTKPNSNFKFTPITFDKSPSAPVEKKSVPPVKPIISKPADSAAAAAAEKKQKDDAEKALERAKRFGIQLNETAKKDIRAQRFGIAAKTETKPVNKGIDPEVLKKRAERFGISDDAAAVASTKGKVPVKFDAAEEDKKRKRAERFGLEAAAASKKQKAE